jgi:hypothetical protein
MKQSRFEPHTIIWWGVATSVVGALLVVAVPAFVYRLVTDASPLDSGLLTLVELLIRGCAIILPTLGPPLIAAGLVMLYLQKNLVAGPVESDERVLDDDLAG